MRSIIRNGACVALLLGAGLASAPVRSDDAHRSAQATSSFELSTEGDQQSVEISNVTFETTGTNVPGRPTDERLLLRTSTHTREVIGDEGMDASVTVDAWPLGSDPAAAPLYTVTRDGVSATVVDGALLVFDRGTEDVSWWSVHALGTGAAMFDSYVPLVRFSLSREVQEMRYAGLDVPPDDAADERLRDPHVVGVLAYASPERVLTRALITCTDPERAALLRSYWDTERALTVEHGEEAGAVPALSLRIGWAETSPSAAKPISASVLLASDKLDLEHAQLPDCMALAPWTP